MKIIHRVQDDFSVVGATAMVAILSVVGDTATVEEVPITALATSSSSQ